MSSARATCLRRRPRWPVREGPRVSPVEVRAPRAAPSRGRARRRARAPRRRRCTRTTLSLSIRAGARASRLKRPSICGGAPAPRQMTLSASRSPIVRVLARRRCPSRPRRWPEPARKRPAIRAGKLRRRVHRATDATLTRAPFRLRRRSGKSCATRVMRAQARVHSCANAPSDAARARAGFALGCWRGCCSMRWRDNGTTREPPSVYAVA